MKPDFFLKTALKAAEIAAEILRKDFESFQKNSSREVLSIKEKTSEIDLITQTDLSSQKAIVEIIHSEFPEHIFLTEEGGTENVGNRNSDYRWVIDPLDGTMNFITGHKNFGTIIALQENNETILAVMNLPMKGLTFYAEKGGGAFVNGKKITLANTSAFKRAYLYSNIRRSAKNKPNDMLTLVVPSCGLISDTGCVIDMIGSILLDEADGAYFLDIPQWDIVAGCLIIKEAGGISEYVLKDSSSSSVASYAIMAKKSISLELKSFVQKRLKLAE